MLDHDYVGTEHLLLGLIHEGGGVAAIVLESLAIRPEVVRERVEAVVGRGEQAPSGHIPFTAQAKDLLRLALEESRALGHSYVGTEHILLGLIHQGDGVAAQVLTDLGADLNGAREQVIRILDEHRRETG
jgi:ATP-dependent Clp protease ATP-binding subunit ClpC